MKYIPIQVSTLKADQHFSFNLFIRVNDKFILYIRIGDEIEADRLQNLNDNATDRLYISPSDLLAYEKHVSDLLYQVTNSQTMPVEQKVEIVESAAINAVDALETLIDEPDSETAYRMVIAAVKGLVSIVNKDPEALKRIYSQKGRNHDLILAHCKNVCALSLRYAYLRGVRGQDLEDLGAASLLHDLGLNRLTYVEHHALFKKPWKLFTPEERRIYQLHCQDAVAMLANREYVNQQVLNLILRHEEKEDGKGYPGRVMKLTELEQILSISNLFDKKVTVYKIEPIKAHKEILKEEIGHYPLDTIKLLKEVLIKEKIIEE